MRKFISVLALMICMTWVASPIAAENQAINVEKMPEMLSQVKPIFPEAAKKAGILGLVTLKVRVDKTGSVAEAKAETCDQPGNGFEQAAVAAALKSKFKPAIADGKPVEVWVFYNVKFDLQSKKGK
jgi:TonB family protein